MMNKRRKRSVRGWARIIDEANPLYWPGGAGVVVGDLLHRIVRLPTTPFTNAATGTETRVALDAVMRWLVAAQDANGDGGVSAYFSLYGGYGPPYPETTGYIIPTMISFGYFSGETKYKERAVRAGDWLLGIQRDTGAFPGGFGFPEDNPSVFNTGQILFGMVALWEKTGQERFREAACRAGNWLADVQAADGSWQQFTYEGKVHVYYTMVAWALAELFRITGDDRFRKACDRNISFALTQQRENGWFDNYNSGNRPVFLHFIAYALQGLLEASVLVERHDVLETVRKPAERLLMKFEIGKRLVGAFTSKWKNDAAYSCLTGNAQMSLVWMRLADLTGDLRFLNGALKMNELLKKTIRFRGARGIRGGIKGSDPVWGKYLTLRYPNWAAKFTADAFMQELECVKKLKGADS